MLSGNIKNLCGAKHSHLFLQIRRLSGLQFQILTISVYGHRDFQHFASNSDHNHWFSEIVPITKILLRHQESDPGSHASD